MSTKKISFIFITSVLIFLANLGIIAGQDRSNETENSVLPEEISTEKYHLKAKVILREEEKFLNKYIDRSDLIWPSGNTKFGSKNSRWAANNGVYTRKPGESLHFLQIPLRPQHPGKQISTDNLGEVKIHYQELFPDNPVQLVLKPIDSGNKLSVLENLNNYIEKESVFAYQTHEGLEYSINPSKKETLLDVSSAKWKEKNFSYLVNRTLGFSPDSYWRYNQDVRTAVFKRHLHKNLHSIGAMDVVLKNNYYWAKVKEAKLLDHVTRAPGHLHCFLRIGYSKRPTTSEIINCRENLPWEIIESNGKYILRVQLSDFVRKQYEEGKKRVFLEELTVYMPGPAKKFINNKIFQTIQFYSNDDTQVKTLKRLTINPDVKNKTNIKNFTLFAKPKNPALKSGFRLKRVQVTSYSEYRKNFYTTAERRMIKQWGGPFLGDSLKDKRSGDEENWERVFKRLFRRLKTINVHLVNLETSGMVSLRQQTEDLLRQIEEIKQTVPQLQGAVELNKSKTLAQVNKVETKISDLEAEVKNQVLLKISQQNKILDKIQEDQEKLKSAQAVERFKVIDHYQFKKFDNNLLSLANDLMTLKRSTAKFRGKQELIELDWSVRARLKENTRLYLGVPEGAGSIISAQVIPVFEEHQLASISAIPNQSVKLNFPGKNIDHLKIRIKLQKTPPSQFTLKEITLFEPVAVTGPQHLRTHFRIPMLKLKEKYIYPVSLKNMNMEGIMSNELWLDFGVHSIPTNISFTEGIKILDHPSLRINSIFVENLTLKEKNFNGGMMEYDVEELEELKRKLNNPGPEEEVSKRVNDAYKLLKRQSNITIPGEEVSERVNDAYKLLNREMKIPEFRPREIPHDISKLELALKSGDLAQANNPGWDDHRWVNIIIKLLLFSITIIVIRWLWVQGWWFSLWGFLKMKTAQRLSKYPRFIHYYQKEPIRFWFAIAGCIYFIGVLALLGGIGTNRFLNICSFGHLAIVPLWAHVMNNFQTKMEDNGIIFTEEIFSGVGGNHYVFGFICCLLVTTFFRISHLEFFAEQFATLGFYILITGTIIELAPKSGDLAQANDHL